MSVLEVLAAGRGAGGRTGGFDSSRLSEEDEARATSEASE